MYNQRTNPIYQKLRDLVKSGELGDIKRIIWIITDWYRSQSYYDVQVDGELPGPVKAVEYL